MTDLCYDFNYANISCIIILIVYVIIKEISLIHINDFIYIITT